MAVKRNKKRDQPPAGDYASSSAGGRRAAQNQDAARRASAKRRKRRRHGNYILYYIVLLLLLLTAGVILSLTVFFKIETITVSGTDKYPNDALVADTGVAIGDNLFRIDTKTIEANMLEYPYVEKVTVRRNYPPEVIVTITEAQPMAAVEMNEGYTIISSEGRILETSLADAPASLPLVIGLRMPGRAGEMVGEEAQEGLTMLRYLVEAIDQAEFGEVHAIDLSDRLNIVLDYNDDITIELGSESDLYRKLRFVAEVVNNQLEPGFVGTLYADAVGKIWVDPQDVDTSKFEIPEGYVFDNETKTFVKAPEKEQSSAAEAASDEENQDVVE